MIRFEHVVKRFGDRAVLDDVSFQIGAGEIAAVVGPSGTGKSVTLKHLVGLMRPDAGKVFVGATEVSAAYGKALEDVRSRVGYLFQGAALMGWMDVADNVALPLREKTKLPESEISRRVTEALKAVELDAAADRMPSEISGGMAKRVGLARALVREADVLLYDEPTSGLDPVTAQAIHNLIVRVNKTRKATSIVVTHDLESALMFADRMIMLSGGRIIADLPPAEFLKSEAPEVREMLASLPGGVRGGDRK